MVQNPFYLSFIMQMAKIHIKIHKNYYQRLLKNILILQFLFNVIQNI